MRKWDVKQIPDLSGKITIVTGGNTGLGFQSSLELARNNATIIVACRSIKKGQIAVEKIQKEIGGHGTLDIISIDLTDLSSIRTFVEEFKSKYDRLDILMNNAGVVNLAEKSVTHEGYEMHMATNHYGHFALTGLLFEVLTRTPGSRVVTMSSGAYKQGNIDFEDLNWDMRKYNRIKSYGDSKLANLLFMKKLQEYFDKAGASAISVAAHPGLSASERQQTIGIGGKLSKWIASPLSRGSRPQLLAATAPFVKAGDFYGPKYGIDGPPKLIKLNAEVFDHNVSDRLWQISEHLTGVKY